MQPSFDTWTEIFKALGDKTRLHILALLRHDEFCVCELVSVFNMSQPAVSQHLRKLKVAGLVSERRTAQWVFYRLSPGLPDPIRTVIQELPDVAEEITTLKNQGLRVQCRPSL